MNKIYFFTFALLTCMLATAIVYGQAPKISPVAPEAAALAKEVNYPISHTTGVADISLPLTEIKSGGMTLPIALNYHSGGFVINERSTSIGLGFSLSCDLEITRTVNGLDDLGQNGYLANELMTEYTSLYTTYNSYPLCNTPMTGFSAIHAYNIANGIEDGMPDKFNYRLLNNKNGSFFFMKSGGHGYKIVTVPYDNTIQIVYHHPNPSDYGYFTVTDSDGTTYNFNIYRGPLAGETDVSPIITSWKCSKIENSTKTAYFNFSWVEKSPIVASGVSEKIVYNTDLDPCSQDPYLTPNKILPWVQYFEDVAMSTISSPQFIEYFGDGRVLGHLPYLDEHNNIIEKTYPSNMGNPGQTHLNF